ncbi:ubiquitin-specific protease ubp1 [Lecanicillium sp. MT-2017a]|nr:ubiquitin-specific protease ubp1 [Lecanicillium sp. MT-2017a]
MTPQQKEFERFYFDHVGARRQPHLRETLWDKLHWSGVTISLAIVTVSVLCKIYAPETTLDAIVTSAGNILLETLVFLIPGRLLFFIDRRMHPSQPMADATTHAAKSDAMRRILGMDRPGGMMASVFQARSRALSVTGNVFGMKLDADRPPGLGNIDNSCYQNSVLQGLSALDSLPEYLSTCVRNLEATHGDKDMAQTLQTLIADLNDLSNNGRTLWTPRLLKSMSSWTQQDAQEYYSRVLDDIDKSVAKAVQSARPTTGLEGEASVKDDTTGSQHSDDSGYQSASSNPKLSDMKLLRNPLEGLLAQRVACTQCGYSDGISMIPFNCLTLSLGLDKQRHDLYERLDSYTDVEAIDGVECPKCTLIKAQRLLTKLVERMQEGKMPEEQIAEPARRLEAVELALEEDDFEEKTLHDTCKIPSQGKVTSTKTKQIVIARPPQSLVIHVNRSVFDPSTFDMIKNSAPVQFPMTLDLGPWCLGSSGKEGKFASEEEELWQSHATSSMVAGDVSPSRISGPIYELRAAVTHYGRHENGHYICYRKYPRSNPNSEAVSATASDAGEDTPEPVENAVDDDETAAPKAPAVPSDTEGEPDAEDANEKPPAAENPPEAGWWRLSDHNVSKVNDDTVLSLSPGVFMLFYECVDPSMILDAEESDDEQDAVEDAASPVAPVAPAEMPAEIDPAAATDTDASEVDTAASTIADDETLPSTVETTPAPDGKL